MVLGAAVLILAFSTDLSLESCQRKPTADEMTQITDEYLHPSESPSQYADYAKDDARRSTGYISDEATQARDELVEHGRNIGQEAINGTVRTTKNVTRSYFGFLGNIFEGVKANWRKLLLEMGYTEEELDREHELPANLPDYEQMGNDSRQQIRDAWENKSSRYDTSSSKNVTREKGQEETHLPNASDSLKKKIYRLPNVPDGRGNNNSKWINC